MILAAVLGLFTGGSGPADAVRDYFSPPPSSPGLVWTKDGRTVGGRELNAMAGAEHCGWESAAFVHLGWPLGTVSTTIAQARQYVRDPQGVVPGGFREGLRLGAALPSDARDTGYRTGALHLWLASSDPDAIYLRVGQDVERWPRAVRPVACE